MFPKARGSRLHLPVAGEWLAGLPPFWVPLRRIWPADHTHLSLLKTYTLWHLSKIQNILAMKLSGFLFRKFGNPKQVCSEDTSCPTHGWLMAPPHT